VKIMIVGAWSWPQYEEAFANGLCEHGVEVVALPTTPSFKCLLGHLQYTLPLPGPALFRLNHKVISEAVQHRPEFILFWRSTHIIPSTLINLQGMGIRSVSYNNDDPFGPKSHGYAPWHHHLLWYWYLKCLPWFDRNFFYRRINCAEAIAHGAQHADVLMPYFMPWKDRPVSLTKAEHDRYNTDMVFVGHYEPDGREHSIRALMAAGIQTKIWGGHYWSRAVLGDLYDRLAPIVLVEGDDYAKALCGAKVCLCFLSKLNRDTYTRRCFEIPACGRVMMAERTDDLLRLFKEDKEACFFSSNEELVKKTQWLLANPEIRKRIADAGLRRVWADGHDVMNRTRSFINGIEKLV